MTVWVLNTTNVLNNNIIFKKTHYNFTSTVHVLHKYTKIHTKLFLLTTCSKLVCIVFSQSMKYYYQKKYQTFILPNNRVEILRANCAIKTTLHVKIQKKKKKNKKMKKKYL